MSGSPVPADWSAMYLHLLEAEVADRDRKNPDLLQCDRDAATVRYSRAVDGIFECLTRLREAQELGRITGLLARKERR